MTIQAQNKEPETSKVSEIISKYSAYFQASPLVIVLLLFAVVPVGIILMYSVFVFDGFVTRPGFTFTNYFEFFSEWSSLLNLWHTTRIFLITWVITLVLGFTISYFLVFDLISFRVKVFFFLLTVVPFWTSGVVRMTSWIPFLGSKGMPIPISNTEASKISEQVLQGIEKPRHSVEFEVGEVIKVIDGPFASFDGMIEQIDEDKSRIKVAVSIFGRSTPVELEYSQVEKA